MIKNDSVRIVNKLGLHARACAKLVKAASHFASDITLESNDRIADAKSIMSLMMLAASQNTVVHINVKGDDADEAFKIIQELINNRFGEEE
tara:strand:+ start:352 stop:624 length:273 start_codon:yes stop_codon:yes gene_type:complete